MTQKTLVSNSKIIIFVAFVCAALITSLFVYHLSHKKLQPVVANGNATIFPVPKDIKRFTLTTSQIAFTSQNLLQHWTLMVFGFTHCDTVCPDTLNMLAHAYPALHAKFPNLQIVFVTLDPEQDSPDKLATYVHSFHAEFIGATGKIKEIRTLQAGLGIFSQQEINTMQLQHTSSIILLNPQGGWAGLFKFGMKPDEFVSTVSESITILSKTA